MKDLLTMLSVPEFLAWAKTKDPDDTFYFMLAGECACGQYARHIGATDSWMNTPLGPLGFAAGEGSTPVYKAWQRLNDLSMRAALYRKPPEMTLENYLRNAELPTRFGDLVTELERELVDG